jgi:hypothetical protein
MDSFTLYLESKVKEYEASNQRLHQIRSQLSDLREVISKRDVHTLQAIENLLGGSKEIEEYKKAVNDIKVGAPTSQLVEQVKKAHELCKQIKLSGNASTLQAQRGKIKKDYDAKIAIIKEKRPKDHDIIQASLSKHDTIISRPVKSVTKFTKEAKVIKSQPIANLDEYEDDNVVLNDDTIDGLFKQINAIVDRIDEQEIKRTKNIIQNVMQLYGVSDDKSILNILEGTFARLLDLQAKTSTNKHK